MGIAELRIKINEYFDLREEEASSRKNRREIGIASVPDLCRTLGITVKRFDEFESGTDEEAILYDEAVTRYEALCEKYRATGLMEHNTKSHLDKTRFARSGAEGKQKIVLVFSKFFEPDNWDEYLKWEEEQKFNKAARGGDI